MSEEKRKRRAAWQFPHTGCVVHDNFDGSQHCVECEGPCVLTGNDWLATALVRDIIECAAQGYREPNFSQEGILKVAGIDIEAAIKAASRNGVESRARR